MIYLDHAATTPLDPRVLEVMMPYLCNVWGNPSSPHSKGREARSAIDESRQTIADLIGVKPHEVIFTASGSEANSLAMRGRAEKWIQLHSKPGHIITASVEHSCTLKMADKLEAQGWTITKLGVDTNGRINPDDLKNALTEDTALVTLQWANNEVGTIQPVEVMAALCEEAGVPFHCDAVQGIGVIPLPTKPFEMMTIVAHKFYGPKGIGALIVRDGIQLSAQVMGGGQEFDLRAGTEDTPSIVGMAKALELAISELGTRNSELQKLRDSFIENILREISCASLNGSLEHRLPNNVNMRFAGHDAETVVIKLDLEGICVSSGAACVTGSTEPSHVLQAMGKDRNAAKENVRITLGKDTTKKELDTVVEVLKKVIV
ncbi:MAG: cysteine desulfurase family protein [bacterium]|nr:cysteine desulfurase family protein [bacterium]